MAFEFNGLAGDCRMGTHFAQCPVAHTDRMARPANRETLMNLRTQPLIILGVLSCALGACAGQLPQGLNGLVNNTGALGANDGKPTDDEATTGLREALVAGITRGADLAAVVDGYYGNAEIRIPFPQDFLYVADKVRQLGFGQMVEDFVRQLNRGAERAANKAAPIFKDAILSMTITDVWGILRGGDDAATLYLERTTSVQLAAEFRPVIQVALDEVQATKYYRRIIDTYNRIPLVQKVNPDLADYATEKAIHGLFVLVAREEAKIRRDPIARTTAVLKKVFEYLSQELT
jgi:hypothetical protein